MTKGLMISSATKKVLHAQSKVHTDPIVQAYIRKLYKIMFKKCVRLAFVHVQKKLRFDFQE